MLRRVRAFAASAEFVNRPGRRAGQVLWLIVAALMPATRLSAGISEFVVSAAVAPLAHEESGPFRLSLALREEQTAISSLQHRSRRLRLAQFMEPDLPSPPLVRLGTSENREGWDWAGLRRQLTRAVAGTRRIRFEREFLGIESERFNEPGRIPGLVQDAAIAAGVRSQLAGEPTLRGIVVDVQCREGCVRLRGQFANCPIASRILILALAVEGVREVRADLPDDLRREMAAGR